jgi:FAD/FMN-containing dehydrogenase
MAIATSIPTVRIPASTADPIDELRSHIKGEVIRPDDAGYEEARGVHVLNYDQKPRAIVRAAGTEDVAEAVRFARRLNIPLAVRSGGHSVPGLSMRDGIVTIDLAGMKAVQIDPATKRARVQAGATSGDLAGPAHEYGLALTTGDTSTVGLGGLVTGGGIGLMARKHGLTIDNLVSATVVTADGNVITASADENADLFWGIRGGGGNFGIITEFEFQLAEVGTILGGLIILPATREVVRGYLDYMAVAPEGLTTITDVMGAPPAPFIPEDRVGEAMVMVLAIWTGDLAEGEGALAPLRELAEPIADTVSPMPYPAIYEYTRELEAPHGVVIRQTFADDLSDEAIDGALEAVRNAPGPINMLHLRGMGGAVARVAEDAAAFAHRTQRYFVAAIAVSEDAGDESILPNEAWVSSFWPAIEREGRGAYVNFLQSRDEDAINRSYPPATLQRLRDVKAKFDPDNVFRFNQNIQPA